RSINSSSLNTARERQPSACAFFTYGSLKCSWSQRELDLLRATSSQNAPRAFPGHWIARIIPCKAAAPAGTPLRLRTPFMLLTPFQKRYLRGLAHSLSPIVLLGQKSVTPNVINELVLAIGHHELVKVKLSGGDREERAAQIEALCTGAACELVQ